MKEDGRRSRKKLRKKVENKTARSRGRRRKKKNEKLLTETLKEIIVAFIHVEQTSDKNQHNHRNQHGRLLVSLEEDHLLLNRECCQPIEF